MPLVSFQSRALGVTHEENPISFVERTDAASWEYDRPCGVAFCFQVSAKIIEPSVSNC